MKQLEAFRMGKTGRLSDCEDFFNMTDHFAIVVDGVTSKSNFSWENETPGQIAARKISEIITQFPIKITLAEACQIFTQTIEKLYLEKKILSHMRSHPVDRFTCSAIIYSHFNHEIWSIGDCQCLISGKHHQHIKLIDEVLAKLRSLYLTMEILSGKNNQELLKHDTGRDAILPFLKKQGYFQNSKRKEAKEYKYGVIDGFPIDLTQIKVWKVPKNSSEIVLASDGYPILKKNLESTEKTLKMILKKDPLLYKYHPSTKGLQKDNVSFDDRCYLRIAL